MKLSDLTATVSGPKFQRMLVGLSQETFDQLLPYRENREAGGFVRLATELLLALTEDSEGDVIGQLADKLTVHCDSLDDLELLATTCDLLVWHLRDRLWACDNEKATDKT